MQINVTGDKPIYQWDTDRTVTVIGSAKKVFWVDTDDKFLITRIIDGVADIPNILIQKSGTLTCWVFNGTTDLAKTYVSFPVYPKTYPLDYINKDTETVSIEEIVGDCITTEAALEAAENSRGTAEQARVTAEDARIAADAVRASLVDLAAAQVSDNPMSDILRKYQKAISGFGFLSMPNNINGGVEAILKGQTLKNELNYNRDTWAEWTLARATANSAGIEITQDGSGYYYQTIPTALKSSTKYLLLINIVAASPTSTVEVRSNLTGAFITVAGVGVAGNAKSIFTTSVTITENTFGIGNGSRGTSGDKIKIKDIRLFELPSGSTIESDATNLTADQLAVKYPYIKGDTTRNTESQRLRSTDGVNTSIGYLPSVGKRLPDGVCDTIDLLTQTKTQNVQPHTLQASNFSGFDNTALYVDWVKIIKQTDDIKYGIVDGTIENVQAYYIRGYSAIGTRGSITKEGYYIVNYDATNIYISVPKGLYADLNAAIPALSGTVIYYQLATPVITPLQLHGADKFKLYPNGTVYSEPTFSGFATGAITSITTSAIPIKSIRKVTKSVITNHQRVETDVTYSVTITDSNTSITIANFDLKATYFYDVEYDSQYSTNPEIVLNAEVDGGIITHDYGATATAWTLTANESRARYFKLTNAGAAANMIIVPQDGEPKTITNATTYTITVKTATSTGITIATGKTATVIFNGTDYIKISEV